MPTNQPLDPGGVLTLTGDPADGASADIEAHTLTKFCDGIFVQRGTKSSGTLRQAVASAITSRVCSSG